MLETDKDWGSVSGAKRVEPHRQKLMLPTIKRTTPFEIMTESGKSLAIDNVTEGVDSCDFFSDRVPIGNSMRGQCKLMCVTIPSKGP